eukprot:COSAG02_NODE_2080_length_9901_cov_103.580086_4_plen_48_part_00
MVLVEVVEVLVATRDGCIVLLAVAWGLVVFGGCTRLEFPLVAVHLVL